MEGKYVYHRVEKGDTLKSIAKKYGVSAYALSRINNGLSDSGLREGSFIIIGSSSPEAGGNAPVRDGGTEEATGKKGYIQQQDIDEQELRLMAKELAGDNADRLKKLALDRDSSLGDIESKKEKTELSYREALEALGKELEQDRSDFTQDAIKQGISRSSIIQSINRELEQEAQAKKQSAANDREYTLKDLERRAQEAAKQYGVLAAAEQNRYQAELAAQEEKLRLRNQEANEKIARYNGEGAQDSEGYELTDRLLGTLSKNQARQYLQRNGEKLREAWGDDAYDRLKNKYR